MIVAGKHEVVDYLAVGDGWWMTTGQVARSRGVGIQTIRRILQHYVGRGHASFGTGSGVTILCDPGDRGRVDEALVRRADAGSWLTSNQNMWRGAE